MKAADYETAISLLNGVVADYPDNANAYNYLGYAHRKLNKLKAAYRHYSKALELNPKHVGANEYMGEEGAMGEVVDGTTGRLNESDLKAIIHYLKSLPAVSNGVEKEDKDKKGEKEPWE